MKEGFESLGRIRAQGVALLVVAFLAGGLAGFAAERLRASRAEPPPRGARDGFMRGVPRGELPPMFERLNLTAEQETQIRSILDEARPQTEAILDEMKPRLRAVTDSSRARIRAVLTAEQAAQLDSIMQNFERRWRKDGKEGRRHRRERPEGGD